MRRYYKVMLGRGSAFAKEALTGGYIGARFIHDVDFSNSGDVPDDSREFNRKYVPVYLEKRPDKSRSGAVQACSQLWTVIRGIEIGDVIISPLSKGSDIYTVGEVMGNYEYHEGADLMHRREVRWFAELPKDSMSQDLRKSAGGIRTVTNLDKYAHELDKLVINSKT